MMPCTVYLISGCTAEPTQKGERQWNGKAALKKIHIALVTGQYESENEEAEQLLELLEKQCDSAAEARLISGKRIEMIYDALCEEETQIIHFCGPCDTSGNFILQNKQGRATSRKNIHQLLQWTERLPYSVALICFPGRMADRKPWKPRLGKADFLIGMQNHEVLTEQVLF